MYVALCPYGTPLDEVTTNISFWNLYIYIYSFAQLKGCSGRNISIPLPLVPRRHSVDAFRTMMPGASRWVAIVPLWLVNHCVGSMGSHRVQDGQTQHDGLIRVDHKNKWSHEKKQLWISLLCSLIEGRLEMVEGSLESAALVATP